MRHQRPDILHENVFQSVWKARMATQLNLRHDFLLGHFHSWPVWPDDACHLPINVRGAGLNLPCLHDVLQCEDALPHLYGYLFSSCVAACSKYAWIHISHFTSFVIHPETFPRLPTLFSAFNVSLCFLAGKEFLHNRRMLLGEVWGGKFFSAYLGNY